jgi:hypothetical protein
LPSSAASLSWSSVLSAQHWPQPPPPLPMPSPLPPPVPRTPRVQPLDAFGPLPPPLAHALAHAAGHAAAPAGFSPAGFSPVGLPGPPMPSQGPPPQERATGNELVHLEVTTPSGDCWTCKWRLVGSTIT